ncbi:transposase [Paracoccus thiocyanatus]|uniref:transposase n=1 Tax=Paracoccus thiocyanatus TaxID=34006 RepID=UPI003742892A
MVDGRGLPVAITLSAGQASDKAAVEELLATHPRPGDVVADRGYDARAVLDLIAARGGRGHAHARPRRSSRRRVHRRWRRPASTRSVPVRSNGYGCCDPLRDLLCLLLWKAVSTAHRPVCSITPP